MNLAPNDDTDQGAAAAVRELRVQSLRIFTRCEALQLALAVAENKEQQLLALTAAASQLDQESRVLLRLAETLVDDIPAKLRAEAWECAEGAE